MNIITIFSLFGGLGLFLYGNEPDEQKALKKQPAPK